MGIEVKSAIYVWDVYKISFILKGKNKEGLGGLGSIMNASSWVLAFFFVSPFFKGVLLAVQTKPIALHIALAFVECLKLALKC